MTGARLRPATAYGVGCIVLAAAAVGLLATHAAMDPGHLPPEWQFTLPLGLLSSALGWLLLRRRPEQRLGWVVAALGVCMLVQTSVTAYADYSVYVHRLPATPWVYVASRLPSAGLVPLLATLFLLFPTGSLPSHRWRWVARLLIVAAALTVPADLAATAPKDTDFPQVPNPLLVRSGLLRGLLHGADNVGIALGGVVLLVCAASVLVRWRSAVDVVTRDQIKGLLAAAALWPVVIVILVTTPATFSDGVWGELLFSLPIDLMVVAVAVAVLRYRLYEIDRVISRTLSYAVVTAVLAGGYVGCVALATRVLSFSSSIGVAASTLACAAAFNPVRRRVQTVVDHRFNRAHYDAAHIVLSYRSRLRDVVDLDTVTGELVSAVGTAVQPSDVSLWLAHRP